MKRLLLLSLLLNAVLASLALRHAWREVPVPRSPRSAIGEPAGRRGVRITRVTPSGTSPITPWSGVESRDPRQLMANLRAIGCPEQTLRDIVVFRICREFRARLLAMDREAVRAWDFTRNQEPAVWWERNARQRELRDEMYAEQDAVLGQGYREYSHGLLGFGEATTRDYLPLDKRRLVRETESRYRRLSAALESEQAMGLLDAEGAARLAELRRQQQTELATLLSPQEVEEYLYRESPAAQYVLARLPQAPSEAEFRAIVKVATELEMDPNAGNDFASRFGQEPSDPALAQAQADREAAFQQRLKAVLGDARVAEQAIQKQAETERERVQEEQRREAQVRTEFIAMADSVGIEAAAAERFLARLKELQTTLEPRLTEFEKTLTGTPEEKRERMQAAVKAELEARAVEILGERGRDLVQKLAGEPP